MTDYIKSFDKYLGNLREDVELAPERIARMYLVQLAAEFVKDDEQALEFAEIVEERLKAHARDKNELMMLERFREELTNNYDEYARKIDEFLKANSLSSSAD